MKIVTHGRATPRPLGTPISVEDDVRAEIELTASEEMAVDERGLVHGGFTFGLADYTAMLAVNHPFVVLGRSESHFIAPVRVGDKMRAKAMVTNRDGGKRKVEVEVKVDERSVYKGVFTCYILDKYVLVK